VFTSVNASPLASGHFVSSRATVVSDHTVHDKRSRPGEAASSESGVGVAIVRRVVGEDQLNFESPWYR